MEDVAQGATAQDICESVWHGIRCTRPAGHEEEIRTHEAHGGESRWTSAAAGRWAALPKAEREALRGPLPDAERFFRITKIPDGMALTVDGRPAKVGDMARDGAPILMQSTVAGRPTPRGAIRYVSLDVPDGQIGARPGGIAIVVDAADHASAQIDEARAALTALLPRRQRIAKEIADKLIEDLRMGAGTGGCICDDQTDDARALIVAAIEDAMVREAETT